MFGKMLVSLLLTLSLTATSHADALSSAVEKDYDQYLEALFDYFHRNPELSMMETNTSARLAKELRAAGFEVTERVGGTGIVAIMENGPGPQCTASVSS